MDAAVCGGETFQGTATAGQAEPSQADPAAGRSHCGEKAQLANVFQFKPCMRQPDWFDP